MVARGDLGIEIPYEELLVIVQRRIVKTCLRIGRPVIVARAHMLESMIEAPMPTRCRGYGRIERGFLSEADAIMLQSGETTVGKYPLKCITEVSPTHRHVRIERSGSALFHVAAELTTARQKLVKSAVVMANELKCRRPDRVHPSWQHGAICQLDAPALFTHLRHVRIAKYRQ